MTTRRMIAANFFEDDFICDLEWFGRLLWVGLVVTADDQGRMRDNADLLRSKIFPTDLKVQSQRVQQELAKFERAHKIIRYSVEGKPLLQLINWWKYQTPSWASPSKYPPPPGWVDRVKVHTTGRNIVTSNWDHPGGIAPTQAAPSTTTTSPTPSTTYPSTQSSTNPPPLPINEVKDDFKEDVEVNGEGEDEADPSRYFPQSRQLDSFAEAPSRSLASFPDSVCPDAPELRHRHSAVKVYYAVVGKWPPRSMLDFVISNLGSNPNRELFAKVYQEWCARGYNPLNLSGILEWYHRGDVPPQAHASNAPNKPTSARSTTEPAGFAAVRQVMEEIDDNQPQIIPQDPAG